MSEGKVIKPTVITDAMITSINVPEPDVGEVPWNGGTAYLVGNEVIRSTTHMKYGRKVAGTTAAPPESDTVNWYPIGPTNQRGMLDRKTGTLTKASGTLSIVLRPGPVSGVGVLEIAGRSAAVTLKDAPGGTTVYSRTVSLDGTVIESVYDWFFTDYDQLTDFVLTDLPQHFGNGELTIDVVSTTISAVGVLQVGQVIEVGDTEYGATVGIIDYSGKDTDEFGNTDVLERGYSKRNNMQIMIAKADFNRLFRFFASIRATPCIYIGVDQAGYEPMITYGFYKSFSMVVSYPMHFLCNLETEGL